MLKRSVGSFFVVSVAIATVTYIVGCDLTPSPSPPANNGGSAGAGGTSGSSSSSSGNGGEGGINLGVSSSSSSGDPNVCSEGEPTDDLDQDGFTEEQGDCNDCDADMNPAAAEIIWVDPNGSPPRDENCNGLINEAPPTCDDNLALDSEDPMDAAKAIGLCSNVISAKWILADGSDIPTDPEKRAAFHLGHGILSKFGTNNAPHEGKRMLILSSGTARNTNDPGYIYRSFSKGYTSNPTDSAPITGNCGDIPVGLAHDAAGVEFEIQLPSNMEGFALDYHFFTHAWSDSVCSPATDFFTTRLLPSVPPDNDYLAHQVTSNDPFEHCNCPQKPCLAGSMAISYKCNGGIDALAGTPFATDLANPGWSHASSGWLQERAYYTERGRKFRIRLSTYDLFDGANDSSVLIDNWHWAFANANITP